MIIEILLMYTVPLFIPGMSISSLQRPYSVFIVELYAATAPTAFTATALPFGGDNRSPR